MKKILGIIAFLAIILPSFAITDYEEKMQKAEAKHKLKLEKIKRKQELKCLKNPKYCPQEQIKEDKLTLGTVQKNIKIGTSQDEVAMALGSPNIVTTDSEGKETWIYDKMASISSYNNQGFSVGGGLGAAGGGTYAGGAGLVGAGYNKNKGGVQSNQKTLTVVIKFTNNKVSSFKYHMSSF